MGRIISELLPLSMPNFSNVFKRLRIQSMLQNNVKMQEGCIYSTEALFL